MTEDGQPLSIDDLRGVIRREHSSKWTIRVLALLLLVAVVAFAIVASAFRGAVQKVQDSAARTDCSRNYSAIITRYDRQLATDGWLQADRLGSALFNSATTGQRATPDAIKAFGDASAELHRSVRIVRRLPNVDQAVDHGFTLEGKNYPPCPKV